MNDRATNHRRYLRPIIAAMFFLILATSALAQQGEWVRQDSVWAMGYRHIACADGNHCMATAFYLPGSTSISVIRRSTDGGVTWRSVYGDTLQTNPWRYPLPFYSIAHPTPELCLVGCDSGTIIRTIDGGDTWQRLRVWGSGLIGEISMLDELHGVATAGRPFGLLHTSDGGATWQTMNLPTQPEASLGFGSIAYTAPGTIIGMSVVYEHPDFSGWSKLYAIRTTNGGETWNVHNGPTYTQSMRFVDALHGFAMGNTITDTIRGYRGDHFARTTDGGVTWHDTFDSTLGFPLGLRDFAFQDEHNGIAVGIGKLIRTTDGGVTWHQEGVIPNDSTIAAIDYSVAAYPTAGTIIVGTVDGAMYRFIAEPSNVNAPETFTPAALAAFPNPITSGAPVSISITLPPSVLGTDRPRLYLVDARGATVATIEQPITSSTPARFAWSLPPETPAGVYFLRLVNGSTGSTVATLPVTVMH